MISFISIPSLFCLLLSLSIGHAFIPHPLIAYGALTGDSITHAEITQQGITRSLARYFYDTRLNSNHTNGNSVNEGTYFSTEYTVDDLYGLAYPKFDSFEIALYSLPFKLVLDTIMTQDVLVDFDDNTKKVSSAHYDSEAFVNSSRRILQFRQTVINNTLDSNNDLINARNLLGQLLHTLQDFYSHSNWVEMGKTDINELIGFNETIGIVARPDQATCTNSGCTRIEQACTLWQQITLGVCPLVYYDCQNNILSEINNQQILTSGYYGTDVTDNDAPYNKPTNVDKCSHGSVLDSSAQIPAIGGINKDCYSLLFSPHSNLHKQAASLAIKATERFLNDIRRDVGDENFARLLTIYPNTAQRQLASDLIAQGIQFRFFASNLATAIQDDGCITTKIKNFFKKVYRLVKWVFFGTVFGDDHMNQPTYDLTDLGVDVKDTNNSRAGPYILENEGQRRKKRMIKLARARRYL